MKKTTRNLKLSLETIRNLTSDEAANVNGGTIRIPIYTKTLGTRGLTQVARLCTDSAICPETVG